VLFSKLHLRRAKRPVSERPMRAMFVVRGASGSAVPVTEPLSTEELKGISRAMTPAMLAEVAAARQRVGIAAR
jgi:hypothetical protein